MSQNDTIDLTKLSTKELLIMLNARVELLEKNLEGYPERVRRLEDATKGLSQLEAKVISMETKLKYHMLMATILAGLFGALFGGVITVIMKVWN